MVFSVIQSGGLSSFEVPLSFSVTLLSASTTCRQHSTCTLIFEYEAIYSDPLLCSVTLRLFVIPWPRLFTTWKRVFIYIPVFMTLVNEIHCTLLTSLCSGHQSVKPLNKTRYGRQTGELWHVWKLPLQFMHNPLDQVIAKFDALKWVQSFSTNNLAIFISIS